MQKWCSVEILACRMHNNHHQHAHNMRSIFCVTRQGPRKTEQFSASWRLSSDSTLVEGTHHVEFLLRLFEFLAFLRQRVLGGSVMLHPCPVLCRSTLQSLNIFTSSQPQNWRRRSESLPSIPGLGPFSARRPLYSLCHVAGASAAGSCWENAGVCLAFLWTSVNRLFASAQGGLCTL